ncbi:hypothetical protein [Streptacidiphilus fuscans]|uniref:Uncharacterized protein n=1 Tax=Streptacidiphilus fuscans TaxID=2789292 RepID=A0A931BCA4_9ACTN|nr:hypothetical protein [Streptacidiphilus fuscans]MBF9073931.1 hypothetical protein [Streptacidiphilus fuscans]
MAGIGSTLRQRIGGQRTANGSSRSTTDSATITDDGVDVTLPVESFDLIVRVSISTFRENASWVRKAFTQRGWHCESDATVGPEVLGPAEQELDSHWLVDVPVRGSRAGAESEALLRVQRAVKPSGRLVDIRGAWALSPNGVSAFDYRVYELPPAGRSRMMRLITGWETWAGLRDNGEVLHSYSDQHALLEARRRALMRNGPERPERWGVRRSALSSKNLLYPHKSLYRIRKSEADVVRLTAAASVEFLCVSAAAPWWRHHALGVVGLLAFAVLYCLPVMPLVTLTFPDSSRNSNIRFACAGSALATLLGVMFGLSERQAGPRYTLVMAGFMVVGYGLYQLVRTSSVGKVVLWATPVLISLAPPLAEQIGRLSNWSYLGQFGMSPNDVELSSYAQLQPVGLPLLAGVGACLVTAAAVGLAKRFHIDLGWPFLIFFLVIYSLVVVEVALNDGQHAGEKALQQATAQQLPHDYHGIAAEAVCVYPMTGSLPIHGAPLQLRTPMLTFDSQAAQVALWNPRSSQVTRVLGNEVSLIATRGLAGECPINPGGSSAR